MATNWSKKCLECGQDVTRLQLVQDCDCTGRFEELFDTNFLTMLEPELAEQLMQQLQSLMKEQGDGDGDLADPKKVTEKYRKLCSKLGVKGELKKVDVLYHVTQKENKQHILEDGLLKGKKAAGFDKGPFNACSINGKLEGVYFSVRLEEKEEKEQLPDSSPYGTERIRIPIDYLLKANQHLFFAGQYNIHQKYHAILVLVDESKKDDLEFCYKNLVKLNMHDNPILCLQSTKPFDMSLPGVAALPGEATEPRHMARHVKLKGDISLEVEIFIVGDISLPTWDNVTDKGNRGKPPPPLKDETPPQQTSTDEEVNEDLSKGMDAMSLEAGTSGTPSRPKANTSTTVTAEVVAAAGPVPVTIPVTVAPATPGKQTPAKATASRQLVFPEGEGNKTEHKTQIQQPEYLCHNCGQDFHSQIGLWSHKNSKKCLQQNTASS